jgi:hypothetical protein
MPLCSAASWRNVRTVEESVMSRRLCTPAGGDFRVGDACCFVFDATG